MKTIPKKGLSKRCLYRQRGCWIVSQILNDSEAADAKVWGQGCGGNESSSDETCQASPPLLLGQAEQREGQSAAGLSVCLLPVCEGLHRRAREILSQAGRSDSLVEKVSPG